MQVVIARHEAPPQIAPPPTYTLTLTGLTEREMSMFRMMCNASYRIPNMLSEGAATVQTPEYATGRALTQLLSKVAMAIADKDVRPMSLSEFNT